jgi:hypothetical protein
MSTSFSSADFLTAFAVGKIKAPALYFFPYRGPRSGPEPEGLKGGQK